MNDYVFEKGKYGTSDWKELDVQPFSSEADAIEYAKRIGADYVWVEEIDKSAPPRTVWSCR